MRYFLQDDPCLPARSSLMELLALCERRGLAANELLSGTSLFAADLHKPNARLSPRQLDKVIQRASRINYGDTLPLLLASATLYQQDLPLGKLLLQQKNLGKALACLYFFRQQLQPIVSLSVLCHQGRLSLYFSDSIGLAPLHQFTIEHSISLLLVLFSHYGLDANSCRQQVRIELCRPAPALLHDYRHHWPADIHFMQRHNRLSFPLAFLQQPGTTATTREALWLCRLQRHYSPSGMGLLSYSRRCLQRCLPVQPTPEQLANELGLSPAQLKRLLRQHHSHFSQLLDEARQQHALQLMLKPKQSNRQLASELGYSDEHNFRRAFKRWTGLQPSAIKDWFLI